MKTPFTLDTCERIDFRMKTPLPESITPEKLPTPWLADSEWLLEELAKAREDALRLPWSVNNASNINSVVDRLWRLEQQVRFLLHLHRDGQRAFAKQVARAQKRSASRTAAIQKKVRKQDTKIIPLRA